MVPMRIPWPEVELPTNRWLAAQICNQIANLPNVVAAAANS